MYMYTHTHTHIYVYLESGMATHSSILVWRIAMDRGTWQDTAHGVTESDMIEQLSTFTCVLSHTHVCAQSHSHMCSLTQSCLTVLQHHGL